MNLRGLHVGFTVDGRELRGVVVTRIRGTRWMVESSGLPERYRRYSGDKRIILDRSEFTVIPAPKPRIRAARTPLERLIDKACGL